MANEKSVLISIQPKWCELIASGRKTIEVRKTRPNIEMPFKVYIYCTKQKVNGEILLTYDKKVVGRNRGFRDDGDIPLAGKVIGEFVCDSISIFRPNSITCESTIKKASCLTVKELIDYAGSKNHIFGWRISNLKIYDKPKELIEFQKIPRKLPFDPVQKPPQSWCYVEEWRI